MEERFESSCPPGPYLPRFCFPYKFQVGDWVFVDTSFTCLLEGGRFNHPLTRVKVTRRARLFGNPCYHIIDIDGKPVQDDCPEQNLSPSGVIV